MRKIFFTLSLLCLSTVVWAYDFRAVNEQGMTLYYTITSTEDSDTPTVEVTYDTEGSSTKDGTYFGDAADYVFPETVEDETGKEYAVVGIGESAFAYCGNFTGTLTIPSHIQYLDKVAFRNSGLTKVVVEYSDEPLTTYYGDYTASAFRRCDSIKEVDIYRSFNLSSDRGSDRGAPFRDLASLKTAIVGGEGVEVCPYSFEQCAALTDVTIEEGVTAIGEWAFSNCTSLTKVTFPSTITDYGISPFSSCSSLRKVVLNATEPSEVYCGFTFSLYSSDDPLVLYVPEESIEKYLDSDWYTDVVKTASGGIIFNFFSIDISENAGDDEGNYYATYFVDEPGYELLGATACVVTGVEDSEIATEAIEGFIPEGTALLIESTNVGDYYFWKTPEDEYKEASVSGNMLCGSSKDTMTTVGDGTNDANYYFYKLSRNAAGDAGSVGFYWGEAGGAPFEIPAYKAWLALPKEVTGDATPESLSFRKHNDTDGITAIETATKPVVEGIYTIQGVRVSDMNQKGIYIVNGRKVMVK